MSKKGIFFILAAIFFLASAGSGAAQEPLVKKRIVVVSSYHREYLWTQETNEGLCAGLLKFGYFDDKEQIALYTAKDSIETSKAGIYKFWMDTKRKKSKENQADMALQIAEKIRAISPDLLFLGDDNAANYIGNIFLDSKIPIIFWGVNNTPVKYGLVDSIEKPGHNVTGVYQTGYYRESLQLLKRIVPAVKTYAILSDDTSSGRSHTKKISLLNHRGELPMNLVESVSTNDYSSWKRKALELQDKVDAFFVAQYSGLKDRKGNYIPPEEVAAWYLTNIHIPEAAVLGQFVAQGMLCSADDSGFNQGYEAAVIAHDILAHGKDPGSYPVRTPGRGALMVNRQRAETLGIVLTKNMAIEKIIDRALSLPKE